MSIRRVICWSALPALVALILAAGRLAVSQDDAGDADALADAGDADASDEAVGAAALDDTGDADAMGAIPSLPPPGEVGDLDESEPAAADTSDANVAEAAATGPDSEAAVRYLTKEIERLQRALAALRSGDAVVVPKTGSTRSGSQTVSPLFNTRYPQRSAGVSASTGRSGWSRTSGRPAGAGTYPDDADMEKKAMDLVGQFQHATSDHERKELRALLEELTQRHFDLRQSRRQAEVSRLEERLQKVREAVEKRDEARDLIVRVRVGQLLGELELDDWSVPGRAAKPQKATSSYMPGAPGLPPRADSFGAVVAPGEYLIRVGSNFRARVGSTRGTPAVAGTVSQVSPGLIVVSVGADEGLRQGQTLEVHRSGEGDTYVARVEVIQMQADKAVCRILEESVLQPIQKGDRVGSQVNSTGKAPPAD
ncbi:MAG: hypothetical protein ACYTG0_29555 [Planctomycetota bacterium]|jgi:hypothetical protein